MRISLEISDKRITDLLHGHGGGASPWLHSASGKWTWARGFKVRYDAETDEEGAGTGRMTINRESVQRGLALMPALAPKCFMNFMQENDDDVAFDSAMQCIIFGKLVYA